MTTVRIELAGTNVALWATSWWPPAKRTIRKMPVLAGDVDVVHLDDRIVRRLRRDPETGEEYFGLPVPDRNSSVALLVRVPDNERPIDAVRVALQRVDDLVDGLVTRADALQASIEPRYQ